MKVIHGGTVIQSTFYVVDDEGNVLNPILINHPNNEKGVIPSLNIQKFSKDAFEQAYETLLKIREHAETQVAEKENVEE